MDEHLPTSPETVTVEFTIGIGDGKFSATAIVPAGQTNLTQILPVIQSLSSSFIDGITAQLAQAGRAVSCRYGCASCCRQLVPISLFEAEALAAWIHSLPESAQQQLAQRFHQTLHSLAASGVLDCLLNISKDDWSPASEVHRRLAIDYFHQHIPCPFLVDESCSVYPIRPLACREYLVTSPPELCAAPSTEQVQGVPMPLRFSRALNQIGAEIEQDKRGWIPLVFLFAWMKADAHPGEAVTGIGPEVLYEFVKRLQTGEQATSAQDPGNDN
jgi:Fe-S-cluster containining protein